MNIDKNKKSDRMLFKNRAVLIYFSQVQKKLTK